MITVASLDSSSQTGNANGGEWQEEIYQKVLLDAVFSVLNLKDFLRWLITWHSLLIY